MPLRGSLRYDAPVIPRCFRPVLRSVVVASALLAATAPCQAPQLLPKELEALRLDAAGDEAGAVVAFLDQAIASAQGTDAGADTKARIEAWATEAALLMRQPTPALLQKFDALLQTPRVAADPLLRDRVGLAVFAASGLHPAAETARRADELGVLREYWIAGPFANERGSGHREAFPAESTFDPDAEMPGKQRPVHWRQLPPTQPTGTLPFARIVDPHEQSLVYVAVALVASERTNAVLELGCTGSFKVFCNRAELASREVERQFAYDQDAVLLPLQPGANLLVLKLCHQEGVDFWAAARLRPHDGASPLPVRVSVARDEMTAAAQQTAVTSEGDPVAPALGARSHWTIGKAAGADALRLAWAWRARAADGDKNRRDLAAANAAVEAMPDLAEAHLTLAAANRRNARTAADRDENARRRELELALAKEPNHVGALVELGTLLRTGSNLWRDARVLADRALAVRPDHGGALLLRIATLRDEGLGPVADGELLAAAKSPEASTGLLQRAAEAVAEREPRIALALRERVLQRSLSETDVCAAATLLARLGRLDDSKALLDQALARTAMAAQASRQLANLHLAGGEADRALALTQDWLAVAPDDANAMVFAGRCWRRRTDDPAEASSQQQALLRSALEVEPTRRDDERYVEYLAADGSGADARSFYTEFRRDPAQVVKDDGGAPADAAKANDPLHWILRQQVVRANGNGTKNVYTHDIARVLSEDGARYLASYRLRFWNGEQRARLLSCTVFRKDGNVQHPALQGAFVRLPDLRPGDIVSIEGRVDDLQPTFFGDYFGLVHSFAGPEGSPVRADDLVVLADPGREYRWQAVNGAPQPERSTRPDGTLQFRWQAHDVARDIAEIRRPDRKEYEPIVRMTTYRDWDHFASWWWNLAKNQIEVTPSMRATIAKLTQGLSDTEAKIAAIYEFVIEEVRYEAWEFGVHGYKPYSTAVIHERRHGDCKDKALLLCAMLGEIGVPCKPVIIFADPLRSRDDLDLAMVEHFNHCIAWLPAADGRPGRFLDGTATWHPVGTLPEMDQGARVLVVDDGRAELRTIPETTPAENLERREYTVTLHADGGGRLEASYAPLGNEAVEMRSMLATEPARRREVVERNLVQTFGKATLVDLSAGDPLDLRATVTMRATADLAEVGQRNGSQWQLPSAWNVGNLQALGNEPERHTPLLLGVPNGASQTLHYRLPPGWRVTDLPTAVQRSTPFGSFAMQWRVDGAEVTVERKLSLMKSRIDVADHAAFRDFVGAVKAADDQLVLLVQEAGR